MHEMFTVRLLNSCSDNLKSKTCTEPRRSIQNLKSAGISAIVVAFAMCAAVALAQDGKTKIRIAIPNASSICCLHLFAAQQWKIFQDNGLDVDIIQMRPQVANAAMVSGEIHYFAGVGPNGVALFPWIETGERLTADDDLRRGADANRRQLRLVHIGNHPDVREIRDFVKGV